MEPLTKEYCDFLITVFGHTLRSEFAAYPCKCASKASSKELSLAGRTLRDYFNLSQLSTQGTQKNCLRVQAG